MKKFRITIILILAILWTSACSAPDIVPVESISLDGMGNPAAVYCQELGFSIKTISNENGEEGICHLSNELDCDAWDFLNGKCGQEYSFCAQQGYSTILKQNKPGSAQVLSMCLDENNNEIGSVLELMDLHQKSQGCGVDLEQTVPPDLAMPVPMESLDFTPPASFDWRSYNGGNWLSPIRNQSQCGSCWAFAAMGVIESVINISRGDPVYDLNLSEQYLVSDCQVIGSYQNCCGGYKSEALVFARDQGIPDEGCLPYVDGSTSYDGTRCTCNFPPACGSGCTYNTGGECSDKECTDRCPDWSSRLENITGVGYVGSNPTTIKQYLIDYGPLAVSMRVENSLYSWGDYSIPYTCSGTGTNHAVVIVGYDDVDQYWIVRNSWGTGFGENGYFQIGYGECGVESSVYYSSANEPPNIPSTPSPNHSDLNVALMTELIWTGGDPNLGDAVSYNVYLEAENSAPGMLICDDSVLESCSPGRLLEDTTYYWQVGSRDNHGSISTGPIWQFTTEKVSASVGFYVPTQYRWYFKTDRVDGWSGVISMGWGGASELIPVTGDWDGDGVDTAGFYKPSQYKWLIKNNQTDGWVGVTNFNWGGAVDLTPIAGDWDGDGDDTVGFYKESTGEWLLKDDNTGGWSGFTKVIWDGTAGNIPLVGDWDGDGRDTLGFFIPLQNKWWIKNDLVDGWAGVTGFSFGTADPMEPVTGDWDGDGTDTVGAYVPAKWRWYLKDDLVSGWSNVSILKFGPAAAYEVLAGDWQ